MGGNNEIILPGKAKLRMHENNACVHIHDDKNKVKFETSIERFRRKFRKMKSKASKTGAASMMDDGNVKLVVTVVVDGPVYSLEQGKRKECTFQDVDDFLAKSPY